MNNLRLQILICKGTGCVSAKSDLIKENFDKALEDYKIHDVEAIITGCFGFCGQGPIVKVEPDNVFYTHVSPEDVNEIVAEHIIHGRPVKRLLYRNPKNKEAIYNQRDMNFYGKQTRLALKNCGKIDPENIYDYISYDGYQAILKVLTEMSPQDVIDVIKASGLRGRGGGGFPTGIKWQNTAMSPGDEKYIFCNADEGDPGAFMDRSILEGDPNSIVEAMTIGGYATGANHGVIYIRAEYPLAIHRLKTAIGQARDCGFLGKNIFNSGFDFDIEIRYGAGAFVCGEETALIHSVEGKRGEPTRKPPFPSVKGYKGKPTTVNNVETYANIPQIILKGADWFASRGTEKSKGTKVFALAGKVNNVGLVEVPMGITMREIVYDIGGGIPNGKKFKAVQIGGPSGGMITKENIDTPIDYENLKEIGAMMGSGGLIVMDEDNDMVDIAKFYLEFTQDESCGKCTPCRLGTKRLLEMLEKLLDNRGSLEDLQKIEDLCHNIINSAACGLGQTAPNPILSTMRYFPDEYLKYAKREMKKYYKIDKDKCVGCHKCAKECPVKCISGEPKEKHEIDKDKCIACGTCAKTCPVGAIAKAK
ncbi:NADH-quinone oxidoreductase subunit NuoF [Peptoniphilus phoceensis]|uniref:NADH-quinone oxidoreductase subunit NuoF n=1 Tax=Peptoniphilus phoceensis TaxID=1720298 RepID=UPI000782873B|nr:NADH-quinone oxidoreductase subunit NuoF [Peptoniphilus phoceensis]